MKKAIKYNRFSHDGQSNSSIERQDMINDSWMKFHKIDCVDTFNDEGYTARTFDRPDIKKLFDFIKKNRGIDYLVVSELTRFSREAGDAINMVKKIQAEHGIRIVSASRGSVYDCTDHNSFFMMGLEFLLGNQENIKRQNDINGGIYTAKAVEGRWIQGGAAPFGFRKEGSGKGRHLEINDDQARVIRFIYDAFLKGSSMTTIESEARRLGLTTKGKTSVLNILRNPLYNGRQYVKPYKDHPGGLFEVKVEKIIDAVSWGRVQEKLQVKDKPKVSVSDEVPLRGVLKSECGRLLTAAPSKGKMGKYYYYYMCNHCRQKNLSAIRLHDQLADALSLMSLPERIVRAIRERSRQALKDKTAEQSKILMSKKRELEAAERSLESVESKWIADQMKHDTYLKWHETFTQKVAGLKEEIRGLDRSRDQVEMLMAANLEKMLNLKTLYQSATTTQKQRFINLVFDRSLYYKGGVYRTPYMMDIFSHSVVVLREKKLLEMDCICDNPRDVEATGEQSNPLIELLGVMDEIRVA